LKKDITITLSSEDVDEAIKEYLASRGISHNIDQITYSGDEVGDIVVLYGAKVKAR